jgi:putative endonuclease
VAAAHDPVDKLQPRVAGRRRLVHHPSWPGLGQGEAAMQPSADRLARYRRGRLSELAAALLLVAKGYRILARRCRTPYGEIDLIAVRGRRLAVVEVKHRPTREEAEAALTHAQARRIADAAEYWIARHRRYHDYDRGLDAVLVVPCRLPAHLPDALQVEGGA